MSLDSDSDSYSDLDSSEKANEDRRKVPTPKHNKNNGKSVKKQKRGVYQNSRNNRSKNLKKDEGKASKNKEKNHLAVTIVGDSQVNHLNSEKLCNNKRKIEMKTKGDMKVKVAVERVGTCKS